MICHGVAGEQKLGCNLSCVQWDLPMHAYTRRLAIITWGKPAVGWVTITSEVTQPSPLGS